MRISDWSSDVCSSDLRNARRVLADQSRSAASRRASSIGVAVPTKARTSPTRSAESAEKRDRKSVVEGKSVSVRVDLGGRRIIKKQNKNKIHATQITTRV